MGGDVSEVPRRGSLRFARLRLALASLTVARGTQSRVEHERVRAVVLSVAPGAEEGTSYGMPAFRYAGRPLLGFRASKKHLSIHPFSAEVVDAVRDRLGGFDVAKGTIRFTPETPVPEEVLTDLVRLRRQEISS